MASTQNFVETNGTAGGLPPRGTSSTTGISNINYGSVDSPNIVVANAVITGGTRSYDKFLSIEFGNTFNTLSNLKFQHCSGNLGAGLTIWALVSGSGFYTTPSQSANSNLVRDLSSTGLASTGLVVPFVSTGAWNKDYSLTTSLNPATSTYMITQLATTTAASPGNLSENIVYVCTWDES